MMQLGTRSANSVIRWYCDKKKPFAQYAKVLDFPKIHFGHLAHDRIELSSPGNDNYSQLTRRKRVNIINMRVAYETDAAAFLDLWEALDRETEIMLFEPNERNATLDDQKSRLGNDGKC